MRASFEGKSRVTFMVAILILASVVLIAPPLQRCDVEPPLQQFTLDGHALPT